MTEQSSEVPSIVFFRKLDWIPIFDVIKMKKIIDGIQYFKNTLAVEEGNSNQFLFLNKIN